MRDEAAWVGQLGAAGFRLREFEFKAGGPLTRDCRHATRDEWRERGPTVA
jgi:hypothetical protein